MCAMRPASSESAISCRRGSAAAQSSSASRKVGATAEASAARVRSRDTTTQPAVAAAFQGREFHFGFRCLRLKCFFRPFQQSM